MIKQILGRLPKKPSKSGDSTGSASVFPPNPYSLRSGDNRPSNLSSLVLPGSNSGLYQGGRYSSSESPKANESLGTPLYEALPAFRDVPSSEKQTLFIKKLHLCCVIFEFTDPARNLKEKDIKRQTLLELVDYVTSYNGKFTEVSMQEITKMVSVNLFRTLTSPPHENKALEAFHLEEKEPYMDPAWSHLLHPRD